MSLSDDQQIAVLRSDLEGAVYALKATVPSRIDGIADVTVYWSTHAVASGNGPVSADVTWEPYMVFPSRIGDQLPFNPNQPAAVIPIPIRLRNMAFQHKESMLAAVLDEDWAWEGATADLYVAYLQPGQAITDLVAADWMPRRKAGVFGAPTDLERDTVTIPLLTRDATAKLTLRRATRVEFPNIYPEDEGKVIPMVLGDPKTYHRAIRTDAGVFGTLAQAINPSGQVVAAANLNGWGPSVWNAKIEDEGVDFWIGDLDRSITWFSFDGDGSDENRALLRLNVDFGFFAPHGGVLLEDQPEYRFLVANHPVTVSDIAFELHDGEVIYLNGNDLANIDTEYVADAAAIRGYRTEIVFKNGRLPVHAPYKDATSASGSVVVDVEDVTVQPEFVVSGAPTTETQNDKTNYPISAAGTAGVTNPGNAANGNQDTSAGIPLGERLDISFGSIASPFVDSDTTASTLFAVADGNLLFRAGTAGATLGTVSAASKGQFRFVQGSSFDYDQTVSVFGQSPSGGEVWDAWWIHDLSRTVSVTSNRSVDTVINVEVSSDLPDESVLMIPLKSLLVRCKDRVDQTLGFTPELDRGQRTTMTFGASSGNPLSPLAGNADMTFLAKPGAILLDLNRYLVENNNAAYSDYIDVASYQAVSAQHHAMGVSGNAAVIDRDITWRDLQLAFATQTRSHVRYGPSGHTMSLVPEASGAEAQTVQMEFRFPGAPGASVTQAGGPMVLRGGFAEVENTVHVTYGADWSKFQGFNQAGDYYRHGIRVRNEDSVAIYGERLLAPDPMVFWLWPVSTEARTPDASVPLVKHYLPTTPATLTTKELVVSGIGQFYADRFSFGMTRYTFEAGHLAAGLQVGDTIRVAFPVAENVFRNQVCEVEAVERSPINAERHTITARGLAPPRKGLTYGVTWIDVFTQTADTHTDRITGPLDRWVQYWGLN